MSYLARLKQDLDQAKPDIVGNINDVGQAQERPEALAPFEGFEGSSTGGFCPETSADVPNFLSEKKESLENQFYRDPQKPEHGGQPFVGIAETRLVREPSEPSKGSEAGPSEWRRRFYALSSVDAPCPGFRLSMDWRETFDAAHAFLEQRSEKARALGWDTLDLFAVHHTVGGNRIDCCGALMLSAGSRVASVDRDVIQFVRLQDGQPCGRFFRVPHTPEMIPVWEFGQ